MCNKTVNMWVVSQHNPEVSFCFQASESPQIQAQWFKLNKKSEVKQNGLTMRTSKWLCSDLQKGIKLTIIHKNNCAFLRITSQSSGLSVPACFLKYFIPTQAGQPAANQKPDASKYTGSRRDSGSLSSLKQKHKKWLNIIMLTAVVLSNGL